MNGITKEEIKEIAEEALAYAQELGLSKEQTVGFVEREVHRRVVDNLGYDPHVIDDRHPDYVPLRDPWAMLIDENGHVCKFCRRRVMFIENVEGSFQGSKLLVETNGMILPQYIDEHDLRSALVLPDGTGFTLASRFSRSQLTQDWEEEWDYELDESMQDPVAVALESLGPRWREGRVAEVHWDNCKASRTERDRRSRGGKRFKPKVRTADPQPSLPLVSHSLD